ncbi:hypothetical protein OOT55_02735 [Marinimicrobium sp. C6131]|uniref:hypothetical protein n=1 Tax=Marinimicrobium sp. C6131 TaxID=3022676 RepID=UPI00223E40DC|nr:hypothetical protein [Marinimicrobium sp. C6131]UZJ44989.1 hypothetical protein OOT55_02735 [Marinimicrobium sp. C6131]
MIRDIDSRKTEYIGTIYRSRTEARWAVFFDRLGVTFEYEKNLITLSSGEKYLPDFYIHDFDTYLEVKSSSEEVVTEECVKAIAFSNEVGDVNVWLSIGAPSSKRANILPLSLWESDRDIKEILSSPENRYKILEDRRDHQIYWLHSEYTGGSFHHSYMIGGPGIPTDHSRLPLLHNVVKEAYEAAFNVKFK